MERKNKTSGRKKFSKIVVGAVIALNVIFTAAILYVFLKTGSEPSVLIGSFFGFTTVEMWNLASIKKSENKSGESE